MSGRPAPATPPPWQDNRAAMRVMAALEDAGGGARYVGGCVRDWLLGRPTGDIDIATTLEPPAVIAALRRANIRPVPTGIDHGTVTAVVAEQGVEITTLRRDVETDGRRAVVGFTRDWAEDAARRDFTINALYADSGGNIHDPTGQGLADIDARRLRFVGDADTRIREDFLRILRFFRFHAQIGLEFDPAGLSACGALAHGLARLSVERIWHETKRLLAGEWAAETLQIMRDYGILAVLLPDCAMLGRSDNLPAPSDPVIRLAALLPDRDAGQRVARGWRLSRREARRLNAALIELPAEALDDPAEIRGFIYRDGREAVSDRLILAGARGATVPEAIRSELENWSPPAFPLSGSDAKALGIAPGPAMGDILKAVEDWWIDAGFAPDRGACLAELKRRVSAAGTPESSPPRP